MSSFVQPWYMVLLNIFSDIIIFIINITVLCFFFVKQCNEDWSFFPGLGYGSMDWTVNV